MSDSANHMKLAGHMRLHDAQCISNCLIAKRIKLSYLDKRRRHVAEIVIASKRFAWQHIIRPETISQRKIRRLAKIRPTTDFINERPS